MSEDSINTNITPPDEEEQHPFLLIGRRARSAEVPRICDPVQSFFSAPKDDATDINKGLLLPIPSRGSIDHPDTQKLLAQIEASNEPDSEGEVPSLEEQQNICRKGIGILQPPTKSRRERRFRFEHKFADRLQNLSVGQHVVKVDKDLVEVHEYEQVDVQIEDDGTAIPSSPRTKSPRSVLMPSRRTPPLSREEMLRLMVNSFQPRAD
eukprot:Platyproteum_vivax@DN1903_c0_g1_i1.p1